MRTTMTLDPDVERLIHEVMHRRHESFKNVVNDAIRAGLGARGRTTGVRKFRLKPFPLALRPGIDPSRLNQLADELEDAAIIAKLSRGKSS